MPERADEPPFNSATLAAAAVTADRRIATVRAVTPANEPPSDSDEWADAIAYLAKTVPVPERKPWENPDGSTNVDGWLAAYAADDNMSGAPSRATS